MAFARWTAHLCDGEDEWIQTRLFTDLIVDLKPKRVEGGLFDACGNWGSGTSRWVMTHSSNCLSAGRSPSHPFSRPPSRGGSEAGAVRRRPRVVSRQWLRSCGWSSATGCACAASIVGREQVSAAFAGPR